MWSPELCGYWRMLLYTGLTAALILTATDAAAVDTGRLRSLLRHDCGACHGITMRGGLGPPLTPEALDGRSSAELVDTVLEGRPGTPMPGWRGLLTAEEARWLVETLKNGLDTGG